MVLMAFFVKCVPVLCYTCANAIKLYSTSILLYYTVLLLYYVLFY